MRCGWITMLLASCSTLLAAEPAKDPPASTQQVQLEQMMQAARKWTAVGEPHKVLEKYIGTWNTELRLTVPGMERPAEKGSCVCQWLMPQRWVQCELTSTMMGMAMRSLTWIGYDNFKMSYRFATVQNLDTALNTSEGDLDPSGKALITYGTIDEYLTGEHDKMVRYIWRFLSPDKLGFEVYDLPIGENNSKVLEYTFTRKQ